MITALTLLLGLASPVPYCPPDTGQVRWDGVRYEFKTDHAYAARGTLWDRDQSGSPTKGDVFRIDAAWVEGVPLPFEELWTVVGDTLAKELQGTFAQAQDLRTSCESLLAINEEPPVMASTAQLARALEQAARPLQAEQALQQRLTEDLAKWAGEVCKKTKYIGVPELVESLVGRAAKPYGALGETRLREAADLAARDRSVTCTRLAAGNISFD